MKKRKNAELYLKQQQQEKKKNDVVNLKKEV